MCLSFGRHSEGGAKRDASSREEEEEDEEDEREEEEEESLSLSLVRARAPKEKKPKNQKPKTKQAAYPQRQAAIFVSLSTRISAVSRRF